jgi:hypothetical protein
MLRRLLTHLMDVLKIGQELTLQKRRQNEKVKDERYNEMRPKDTTQDDKRWKRQQERAGT